MTDGPPGMRFVITPAWAWLDLAQGRGRIQRHPLTSLRRAQELASGLLVIRPDQDLVGPHRRQAVAGPRPTVGQSRQAFDAGAAQARTEKLGFRLGPDNLDDYQLGHTTRRYPNESPCASKLLFVAQN
jgi:hypothetical protein